MADLVKELTSDTEVMEQFNYKGVYLEYKMTLMSLDALLIKLADRLDNVSDFAFADADFLKSYREETKLIIDVVSGRTDLKATHLKLIEKINSALTLSDSFS